MTPGTGLVISNGTCGQIVYAGSDGPGARLLGSGD